MKLEIKTKYIIKAKPSSNRCKVLRKIYVSNVYEKTYEFDHRELILISDFEDNFETIEKIER